VIEYLNNFEPGFQEGLLRFSLSASLYVVVCQVTANGPAIKGVSVAERLKAVK
jgi:hypothetical protein